MNNVDDESLKAWEANVKVHKRGLELIKPGVMCSEICAELNELFANNSFNSAQISEHITPGLINSNPRLCTLTFASQAFKDSSSTLFTNKVLS